MRLGHDISSGELASQPHPAPCGVLVCVICGEELECVLPEGHEGEHSYVEDEE